MGLSNPHKPILQKSEQMIVNHNEKEKRRSTVCDRGFLGESEWNLRYLNYSKKLIKAPNVYFTAAQTDKAFILLCF